jgi:hypothetical protein
MRMQSRRKKIAESGKCREKVKKKLGLNIVEKIEKNKSRKQLILKKV